MRKMLAWFAVGVAIVVFIMGRRVQAQNRTRVVSTVSMSRHSVGLPVLAERPDVPARRYRSPAGASSVAAELLSLPNLGTLAKHLIFAGIVMVVAFLLLLGLKRARRYADSLLEKRRERIPAFRFRGLELVSAQALFRNLGRIVLGLYILCVALVVLGGALIVFGLFPATQSYAFQVGLWFWTPIVHIFRGIVDYLPHLFYILVIILVARFVLRMISYVFGAAERGLISLEPWVHRDVARPTGLIIRVVIIVVALFFIAPLIPGTGSDAAKGISIILGLMISFGSTSTVGNFVAGIVLMYMRPFQLGERVRLGDTVGDVIERTFLYTKVLTIKNEEIIVPSLTALGSPMVNYSARAQGQGLILHTGVTIGYNAPWRQVHELLLKAADRTSHVLKEPKPFVLQTALDDFYVNYQINVYTDQASRMAQIYSELHQNIQDSFNEAHVEICSPHFHQLRDGNTTTVPAGYRDADYVAPGFRIENRTATTTP